MGANKRSTSSLLCRDSKSGQRGSSARVPQVEEVLFCVEWEEGLAVGLVKPEGLEGHILPSFVF